jgi:hypothetical protein
MSGPTELIRQNCPIATTGNDGLMSTTQVAAAATVSTQIEELQDVGAYAANLMTFSDIAYNNEEVVIAGHTFRYVNALAAANTFTQILVGADIGTAALRLEHAINGVADVGVVQATVPFTGNFTAYYNSVTGVDVWLFAAASHNGPIVPRATTTAAVSTTVGSGIGGWMMANMSSAPGVTPGIRPVHRGQVTITAAMLALGSMQVLVPFVPVNAIFSFISFGARVTRLPTVSFMDPSLPAYPSIWSMYIELPGGASPQLQVNDIMVYEVYGDSA